MQHYNILKIPYLPNSSESLQQQRKFYQKQTFHKKKPSEFFYNLRFDKMDSQNTGRAPYQTPQQHLKAISSDKNMYLAKVPKLYHELLAFLDSNIRKQFRSFSFLALCGAAERSKFIIEQNFEKSFKSLSLKQKLDLYQKAVAYGIQAFNNQQITRQILYSDIQASIKEILPQGFKQFFITVYQGFRSNQETKAQIQKFKISFQNNSSINMQNYILRKSDTKNPQRYVLLAINKTLPVKIKFSFANDLEQRQNIEAIQKLMGLAFKNMIFSMILPEQKQNSPSKPKRHMEQRSSIGRLMQTHSSYKDMQIPKDLVKIQFDQKIILQYSRELSFKKRTSESGKQNQQIIKHIIDSNKKITSNYPIDQPIQQNTNEQKTDRYKDYHRIIQTEQDAAKQHNISSIKNKITVPSPIHKFTTLQVQSVQKDLPKASNLNSQKNKNVFRLMLPDFNLKDFLSETNQEKYTQVYLSIVNQHNFTMFQHKQKKQRFKCGFIIAAPLQQVYSTLINIQLLKRWNSQVDESQIKSSITADNCLICYQKHKRYSTWFKQRDFLFMRHAFVYKGYSYIIDRSIQHNSLIPFESIQRGYIRHIVSRLKKVSSQLTQVCVDLSIDHGGYLGIEKTKQLNVNYLKEYENLQKFVNNPAHKSLLTTNYCNLNWSIDWIDAQTKQNNVPQQLSFKTQQFNQGSEIDYDLAEGTDRLQIQSDEFYSVKDAQQKQQQQKNDLEYNFQTTQNYQAFNKKPSKKVQESQTIQMLDEQPEQKQQKQLQQQQNQSVYQQPSIVDDSIILDSQGNCILPQRYLKKPHSSTPEQSHQQERIKKYDNIVLKGDFIEDKQNGLLLVNKEKIMAQDSVINFMLKTMKKNLFSGKSILSISLPVDIFKEDSNTQRLCQSMALGPHFLQKAVKLNDPLQRMKWSICFALSNSLMYFYIQKPFNPILGETYQGVIDGCPVYAEQISHHPPITSLYFIGRGYKVHANIQAKVFLHLNSGDGINLGYYSIQFEDGQLIKFQTAPGQLSGFTIGQRKYKFKDRMYVFDRVNCLYAQLCFQDPKAGFFSKGAWKYTDQMQGQIIKVSPNFLHKFQQSVQKIHPKPKQTQKVLSKMGGRWIYYLNFDGKKYYDIANDLPYKMINYEYPLNSDARYREDMIYRTRNDLAKSQIYKQILQNKQRKDRKLREQYHGSAHDI